LFAGHALLGCRCQSDEHKDELPSAPSALIIGKAAKPRTLYLPDASAQRLTPMPQPAAPTPQTTQGRCAPEMVDVQGAFCIDRYEAVLVDAVSGERLSPYYHPARAQALKTFDYWQQAREQVGPQWARRMPLPDLPAWEREREIVPEASSLPGQVPSGYLSADIAAQACQRAGKRLCTEDEWVRACRGQAQLKFPYGAEYQQGVCNIFSDDHPAKLLHNNASEGHLDPRLNLVQADGATLLKKTGESSACKSTWSSDAAYDMVGNLDEWIDDPSGKFVGGFYARATREGCDASVSVHPRNYFDYSLGTRCCR
jgi:hypothetical protein